MSTVAKVHFAETHAISSVALKNHCMVNEIINLDLNLRACETDKFFPFAFGENHIAFPVDAKFTFDTLNEIHISFSVFQVTDIATTWNPGVIRIGRA